MVYDIVSWHFEFMNENVRIMKLSNKPLEAIKISDLFILVLVAGGERRRYEARGKQL